MKNDPQRNYSLHVGQHHGEIDSQYYTNSVLRGDDGRLYAKRGGDHFCEGAYDGATGKWGRLEVLKCSPNFKNWGGDTCALLTSWKDLMVYCPGDTRNDSLGGMGNPKAPAANRRRHGLGRRTVRAGHRSDAQTTG